MSRAIELLIEAGLNHKNVVCRQVLARILADMSERLGADRLMDPAEKATTDLLLAAEIKMLLDGSLEVRHVLLFTVRLVKQT